MSEQNKQVVQSSHAGLTDWQILRHQAETLVSSGFLPKAVDTWQKATAIIMYGKEIGMGPMEALQSIDVIQGKPTQKPQSMKAMVHKKLPNAIFRLIKSTDEEAIYEAARPNDPPAQFSFTFKDAERMGMTGKDNYKKQPKVMLSWRCIGHVARTVFPDCLSGVSYTPEELGAEVDDEHNIIEVKSEKVKPKEEPKVIEAKADEPPKVEKIEEPEPLDTDIYRGLPKQKAHLMKLFKKHGIDSTKDMVDFAAKIPLGERTFADLDNELTMGGGE